MRTFPHPVYCELCAVADALSPHCGKQRLYPSLLINLLLLLLDHADMENVIFFTPSKFSAKQIYPKKCLIFGNNQIETKQRKLKNTIKLTKNH